MNTDVWIYLVVVLALVAGTDVLGRQVCTWIYRSIHSEWKSLRSKCRYYLTGEPDSVAQEARQEVEAALQEARRSLILLREGGPPLPNHAMLDSSSLFVFDSGRCDAGDYTACQAAYYAELRAAKNLVADLEAKQRRWQGANSPAVVAELRAELRQQVRKLQEQMAAIRRIGRWLGFGLRLTA